MPEFCGGYVALVGEANAGKSTLLNRLMEMPLAPVSHKAQTTRRKMSGVFNFKNGQIILVDLPGYISDEKKTSKLALELTQATADGAKDADMLMLILDARRDIPPQVEKFLSQNYKKSFVVIVNIPARTNEKKIAAMWANLKENSFFENQPVLFFDEKFDVFKKKWLSVMSQILPQVEEPLVDPDLYTLENLKELARERIMEKCFLYLQAEVPYEMDAQILQYKEEKGIHKIFVDLLVSNEKYKPIVIGAKGSMLRKIGESSRKELEKIFDSKIFLHLNVKVKENWHKNQTVLKELGFAKVKR